MDTAGTPSRGDNQLVHSPRHAGLVSHKRGNNKAHPISYSRWRVRCASVGNMSKPQDVAGILASCSESCIEYDTNVATFKGEDKHAHEETRRACLCFVLQDSRHRRQTITLNMTQSLGKPLVKKTQQINNSTNISLHTEAQKSYTQNGCTPEGTDKVASN